MGHMGLGLKPGKAPSPALPRHSQVETDLSDSYNNDDLYVEKSGLGYLYKKRVAKT